jgi:lysozyme family protein
MADPIISIKKTLINEGGYNNDPTDAGGETYRGISRVNHPDWLGWDIVDGYKNHPDFPHVLDSDQKLQDLVVSEYREGYWKPNYSQITNQLLADKISDLGVLFGVGTTIKVLQIVLDLTPDGAFGPVSLEKLNEAEPVSCLEAFKSGMVTHCIEVVKNNPNDRRYFSGWVRRINS